MLQKMFEENILIYAMIGMCGLGIVTKWLVSLAYKRLIKASDQMGSSKNKLMKLMRLKFETCYKLKIGVNNVDVFVDKYVYKHRFCGILLYTWENFSGQLLLICMLTGSLGAVLGLIYECGQTIVLSTFFAGIFTSALLITFENLLNLNMKKNVVRVNIKDYLENYLKVRLEKEYFNPEVLAEYRNEYFVPEVKSTNPMEEILEKAVEKDENEPEKVELSKEEAKIQEVVESLTAAVTEKVLESKPKKQSRRNNKEYQLNKKEEKIIQDILKEYLA
jgi:hypothetical protein